MVFSLPPWTRDKNLILDAKDKIVATVPLVDDARLMTKAPELLKEVYALVLKYGSDAEKERILTLISNIRGQRVSGTEKPERIGIRNLF